MVDTEEKEGVVFRMYVLIIEFMSVHTHLVLQTIYETSSHTSYARYIANICGFANLKESLPLSLPSCLKQRCSR